MKMWMSILSVLLVAQLGLAAMLNLTGEDYGAFQADEKLLAIDYSAVDGVRIGDGEHSVVLKKWGGQWLLPEQGDFPADAGAIEQLLDSLATLEKGWPVATTHGAAQRFNVADDAFERKLELMAVDTVLAELYVGTSPGFRKVHVRPAGNDEVFSVAFNSWEANADADDWIDKDLLKLDRDAITRVEMPGIVLQRQGDGFEVVDLAEGETTDAQEVQSLLSSLSGLRIQSLLGSDARPSSPHDEAGFEINVAVQGGDDLTYRFNKSDADGYYVLKRSDLNHYVEVAEFTVNTLKAATKEALVQLSTEATPGDVAGEAGQSDEPVVDAAAMSE